MTAPRRPTSIPQWLKVAVYATGAILLVTGIAWLILDTWVRTEGEFGPEHHPAEHWTLIAHAIGAYAFLVVVGALLPVHVPLGWNRRRNRPSGVTMLSLCTILAVTALALYYVGEDVARSWSSLIHWAVGLAAVPALVVHVLPTRTSDLTPPPARSPRRPSRPKRGG